MPLNQHSRPLWLAAISAPLLAAPGLVLLGILTSGDKSLLVPVVLYITGIGLAASFVIALPCALALRRVGLFNWYTTLFSGALIGFISGAIFVEITGIHSSDISWGEFDYKTSLAGAAFGFVYAIIFSLVAGITVRSSGRRSGAA